MSDGARSGSSGEGDVGAQGRRKSVMFTKKNDPPHGAMVVVLARMIACTWKATSTSSYMAASPTTLVACKEPQGTTLG
eukprot:393591-Prorocentrum_minimum.AAC.1